MPIEIEEYVDKCRRQIEDKSGQMAGQATVRSPERPIVITFLGHHPENSQQVFSDTLKKGWPTAYGRITDRARMRVYESPEELRHAIEDEDANQETEVDRIIWAAMHDRGVQTTRLLMVYFINYEEEASTDFLELLNREYTTAVGGLQERLIFAIGRMGNKKAMRQARTFLSTLKKLAAEDGQAADLWKETSCVVLSNRLYSGRTLLEDEFMDNYSLSADIMLLQHSRRNEKDTFLRKTLPRVSDQKSDQKPFITATLRRESKPSDDIARTLLYQLFHRAIGYTKIDAAPADFSPEQLEDLTRNEVNERFRQLQLPRTDIRVFLPNRAESGADAGISGGTQDQTFGIGRAFYKRHYLDPVEKAFESPETVKHSFERFFSEKGCFCSIIQKVFLPFGQHLRNLSESRFWPIAQPLPGARFTEWAEYHAKCLYRTLAFSALVETVRELHMTANDYIVMINSLHRQVTPSETTVKAHYSQIVDSNMGMRLWGEETLEDVLKRPQTEEELKKLLDAYIEQITDLQEVRLDFSEELKARLADDEANSKIKKFLEMSSQILEADARMNLVDFGNVVETISDAALFDSEALLEPGMQRESSFHQFELCGTNGMDRVVLYQFDGSFEEVAL